MEVQYTAREVTSLARTALARLDGAERRSAQEIRCKAIHRMASSVAAGHVITLSLEDHTALTQLPAPKTNPTDN